MESGYEGPINIGNPEEFSIKDLADIISDLVGVSKIYEYLALPDDDPPKRKPDISLVKSLLGWKPEIPLKEGLERTIRWFRKELQ
jgi:UDP-glucuronate decarboxylase